LSASDGNTPEVPDGLLLAAATPVTDGRCVYAIFGNGAVGCLDFQGEVKWSRDLGMPADDYGHATSLEMWEGLLFVQLDQGQAEDGKSKLMALHAESGRTAWQAARPVPCSWASPIVVGVGQQSQLLTCAEPWLIAYEPATGQEMWRADCLGGQIVPSPIYANGLVYVVSPDASLAAVRPGGRGDTTRTHIVWTAEENLPSVCSPVCNGELVWLVDSGSVVTCCDAKDGRKVWEHELGGSFQASPTVAGNLLYVLSDGGTLFVLEAGRQYALVDRVELGEGCQASPSFRQGRMYIRTKRRLVCLGGPISQ
jgi:outer membrane protein assembly factor BamB